MHFERPALRFAAGPRAGNRHPDGGRDEACTSKDGDAGLGRKPWSRRGHGRATRSTWPAFPPTATGTRSWRMPSTLRGAGEVPGPLAVTVRRALSGDYDCRRVVMEGLLLQASLNPQQPTLLLQSGDKIFMAQLADASELAGLAAAAENSLLRLEGSVSTPAARNYSSNCRRNCRQTAAYRVSPAGGFARRRDRVAEALVVDDAADPRGRGRGLGRGSGGILVGRRAPLPCRRANRNYPPATGPRGRL